MRIQFQAHERLVCRFDWAWVLEALEVRSAQPDVGPDKDFVS